MKEAAGEANMTVITIILIGVIAAIAIPIVNNAMKTTQIRGCCTNAGGTLNGSGDSATCVTSGTNQAAVTAAFESCKSETSGK